MFKVYRPGPLPWGQIPIIGEVHSFGLLRGPHYGSCDLTIAIMCPHGRVTGYSWPETEESIRALYQSHNEDEVRALERRQRKGSMTACMGCRWEMHDQRVLIRTANRRN